MPGCNSDKPADIQMRDAIEEEELLELSTLSPVQLAEVRKLYEELSAS